MKLPRELLWAVIISLSIALFAIWPTSKPSNETTEINPPHETGDAAGGGYATKNGFPVEKSRAREPQNSRSDDHAPEVTILGIKPGEWLLGIVTWMLWYATMRLVSGADNTSKRQLRAYVGVTNVFFETFVAGEISVLVRIKNFGTTPANNCATNVFLTISQVDGSDLPSRVRDGFARPCTLMPGDSINTVCRFRAEICTQELIDFVTAGNRAIGVFGAIRYEDFAGDTQYTDVGHLGFGPRLKSRSPFIHAKDRNNAT
jgi:hypothetical protein